MLYKPRSKLILSVPKTGAAPDDDGIAISPHVISATWERNHHLEADALTVTIPWRESGIDPRHLKNARCAFYLWDANYEDFDDAKHLRFTGVAKSAKRVMTETESHVELKFHDYTDMFISMKPFPSDGIPDFTDDLISAWHKLCDHTGWWDDEGQQIRSSVEALKDSITIDPRVPGGPIGRAVASRFHAIAKPQPPHGASAWEVWQYVCGMLGVVSYIDKDTCIVTTDAALYSATTAPVFLQGENIHSLEEEADTAISNKAILLKSFDPLKGEQLEAIYPPPGDVRVKTSRAAAKRAQKNGTTVSANDVSRELECYFRYDLTDQATLDAAAKEAYAARSRQELTGSFKTTEMRTHGADGSIVDVLSMTAGDSIKVGVDPQATEVRSITTGEADQIAYLTDRLGYDEGLARLIVENLTGDELESRRFHVKSLDVHLGPDSYESEIKYFNVIETTT
jgi:hypothetical protein